MITSAQVGRQVYDVRRSPDPVGLSLLTWLLALTQSLGLLVLSVDRSYVEAIVANGAVAVACCAIIVLAGVKRGARPLTVVSWIVGVAVVIAAGRLGSGARLAGTIGAGAAAVVWLPQAFRAFRIRRFAGLSMPFIAGGFLSSVLWIVYAAAVGEWRLVIPPSSAIVALALTLFYARRVRRQSSVAGPE